MVIRTPEFRKKGLNAHGIQITPLSHTRAFRLVQLVSQH